MALCYTYSVSQNLSDIYHCERKQNIEPLEKEYFSFLIKSEKINQNYEVTRQDVIQGHLL